MAATKLMGILNATPDSFYDGGKHYKIKAAIRHGLSLYEQGADIIDVGGESTRPGSRPIPVEEEMARVIPVLEGLKELIPIRLSIDTVKPQVASKALAAGATLINDISGFQDPVMRDLAAESQMDICVMHMHGIPETMQNNPTYEDGVTAALLAWFEKRINLLLGHGVKEERIIIDPGIGFGKTVADNLEIIQNLPKFKAMGFPLLLGLSRKSFMSKILNKPASELLPATIVMNTAALLISEVDILRVHDVGDHRSALTLLDRLKKTMQPCELGRCFK